MERLIKNFFILVVLAGGISFAIVKQADNKTESKPKSPTVVLDSSPETQAKRKALIENLINEGIFYKVEVPSELPHIYVANQFYALNIDDKTTSVNLVLTYYYANNPKSDFAILHDHRTGKQIGTYSFNLGLRLD